MPDYKAMYLSLFHATEQAIDTLIAAQREMRGIVSECPGRGADPSLPGTRGAVMICLLPQK